jgi:hypothetical protein
MKTQICRNLAVLMDISVLLLAMTYLGQAASPPQGPLPPGTSDTILIDKLKRETRGITWDITTETPIFFDDFSNPNSGWPVGVFGNCEFGYYDGHYRVTVTHYGQRCIIPNPNIPKQVNGTFSVKARRISLESRPMLYGLIFGAATDAAQNGWALEVYPNNDPNCSNQPFYWLVATVNGSHAYFQDKCTNAIYTDQYGWNELKVTRSGKNVDVYINGQQNGDYSDADYLLNEGYSLLEVVSESNDTIEVEFDDFEVLSDTGTPSQDHRIYLPLSMKNYSPPTPTPTPTPPPSTCPQTGAWSGTTDDGDPISFTVSTIPNCRVAPLTITMFLWCSGFPGYEYMTVSWNTLPISNNHFSTGSGMEEVVGDFTSPTTATGTWDYAGFPCYGHGTWTASH